MEDKKCGLCFPEDGMYELCGKHMCLCGDCWRYIALCPSCENKVYCKGCRRDNKYMDSICSDCHEIIYNYKVYGVKLGDKYRRENTSEK